ncbi:ABC transporter substrate-binding protein [Minwuia thermotolerans]|uniref:Peptide ABC transporter substrate-binding protein n=1 Tax=Minwuia thermotolerans TaxID=2056226 RepID=A0A2M9G5T5_9PROT|nr:ABC transporter substrate-binding protein [Minwuia thermotolerans]PJK31064.1 peptide ABC transporter substrate-binding protein [Minwuia thermotolerans]
MIRWLAALFVGLSAVTGAAAESYIETPWFEQQVESRELPPVNERLPDEPLVVSYGQNRSAGLHGGDLNILIPRDRYLRHMVVYSYARLVGYDRNYDFVADIAKDFTVEEGRIFTFHLRRGHKWSDGHPLTSDDFRYFWEDLVLNEELNPGGVPAYLQVEGHSPVVEFPDKYTVRYTWPAPNPQFLPRLAGASPLFIYRPAHYLKQFHVNHADPEELARKVEAAQRPNWASLHNRRDRMYRFDNIEQPTLQPWKNRTEDKSTGRFEGVRNPYFHKVDENGRQLPYLDRMILTVASPALIPAQAGSGQTDLQALGIRLVDWTFLKEAEDRGNYDVYAWETAMGAEMALFPNLNYGDPYYRELLRDVRFRRALSLAIDRELINEVIYFGDAREQNNTVLPRSRLYEKSYAKRWAEYDPERANALLDELGLTERSGGIRLLPDGRKLEVIVETSGEDPQQIDILELIGETWREVGVKLFIKPSQRDTFRNRVSAGLAMVSVWNGIQAGLATPEMSPEELAPTSQLGLQWPKWGLHHESGGTMGSPPDMELPSKLLELYKDWKLSTDTAEKRRIWHEMLEINVEQVYSIGVVTSVPQPVVVRRGLRNVPKKGVYHWDPGAYFGIYNPDTFWYEPESLRTAAR